MLSQLHIAPTLATFFKVPLTSQTRPVKRILDFVYAHNPPVILLLVVDSLDFRFYTDFADDLPGIHKLVAQDGLLYECETVNSPTTPAIGSILTGLPPEAHGIFTNNDVGTSKIRSILEILEDQGQKTALVLETGGGKPLLGKISYVFSVDDREDIVEYDELIKKHTLSVLKQHDARLVFSHLRAIDRYAHRGWDLHVAAHVIDEIILEIADALSEQNGLLVICGDHETHFKDKRQRKLPATVPLIVCSP